VLNKLIHGGGLVVAEEAEIKDILNNYRTIAVVGISSQKIKDSHIVAEYMKSRGYRIIPINPFADEILGEKCYKSLLEMPEELQKQVEIVDIFRPSDKVMPIVEEAVKLKEKHGNLKVIWMQLGIANEEAARKAEDAGLKVIMNKCIMSEHKRLIEEEDKELEQIKRQKLLRMIKEKGKVMSEPIKLTDSNFEETVKKYDLMIVDFWAPWCGPCLVVSPIIEELAKEYAGKVAFGKLNVDENPKTASKFGVFSIPTIVFLRKGEEIDRIIGAVPKDYIKGKIEKYLK